VPPASASRKPSRRVATSLDALAFSSVWVAVAAGALAAACSLAMGIAPRLAALGLAFSGTLVVYNVDRLRDLDRDRATTPQRSAFVEAQGGNLALVALLAGALATACALAAGPRAWLVLAPVLALGLLHRRIKHLTFGKSGYLTASWVAVVVVVPAAIDASARGVTWVAAVVACAIFANAIASSVRDREVVAARYGAGPALRAARLVAAAGVAIGIAAPAGARPLLLVPLATLLVLIPFRGSDRYVLMGVDGALLAGALACAALYRI